MAPTAQGLIKTLTQGQTSPVYTLEPNSCNVWQVAFEGGKKRKFHVDVTDSEKGLSYIAAGVPYYNKDEIYGDPYTLERCEKRFDFDTVGRPPQCWGPDYDDVNSAGFKKRNKCEGRLDPLRKELGSSTSSTFKFRGSDSNKCITESGNYYLYLYAEKRTSVTLLVYDGSAKSQCNKKKLPAVVTTIIVIIVIIACCGSIIGGVVFCVYAAQNNANPANHSPTAYGDAPEEYTRPPAGPVQYEMPAHGQLEQPYPPPYAPAGGQPMPPPYAPGTVLQGTVVGVQQPTEPPAPQFRRGEAWGHNY